MKLLWLLISAAVLIAVLTNIGPDSKPSTNEYGKCPQRITAIMAGDGRALTEEVYGSKEPEVLTERGRAHD